MPNLAAIGSGATGSSPVPGGSRAVGPGARCGEVLIALIKLTEHRAPQAWQGASAYCLMPSSQYPIASAPPVLPTASITDYLTSPSPSVLQLPAPHRCLRLGRELCSGLGSLWALRPYGHSLLPTRSCLQLAPRCLLHQAKVEERPAFRKSASASSAGWLSRLVRAMLNSTIARFTTVVVENAGLKLSALRYA